MATDGWLLLASSAAGALLGGALAIVGAWWAERYAVRQRLRERVETDVWTVDDLMPKVMAGYAIPHQVDTAPDSTWAQQQQLLFRTLQRLRVSSAVLPRDLRAQFDHRVDQALAMVGAAHAAKLWKDLTVPITGIEAILSVQLGPVLWEGRSLVDETNAVYEQWFGEPLGTPAPKPETSDKRRRPWSRRSG